MKSLWYALFCCLFLVQPPTAEGATMPSNPKDSTHLLPVATIQALRYSSFQTGSVIRSIDAEILRIKQGRTLDELLGQYSQVFIKSYGPGQLSSSSFRGANAQQTPVVWNGFSLQSPMNGQLDLSLIPSFLLESVQVQYNGQANLYGSGAMGGSLHLQTSSKEPQGWHAGVLLGAGSFSNFSAGIKLSYANKHWQITQKFYNQSAANHFSYYNTALQDAPLVRMQHASYGTAAWLQEVRYARNERNQFVLRSWVQQTQRYLAPAIGSSNSGQQADHNLRLMGEYSRNSGKYQLGVRSALFRDGLTYSDNNTPPSQSHSLTVTSFLDQFYTTSKTKWQCSLMHQFQQAKDVAYGFEPTRNTVAAFGSVKYNWPKNVEQQVSLRQEWQNGNALPLIPSYGVNWQLAKWVTFKGNAGKTYRVPTFNDLYYRPYANPNLLPEYGLQQEVGLHVQRTVWHWVSTAGLTAYNRHISQQITWLPNAVGVFTPVNISDVWSRGLECQWLTSRKFSNTLLLVSGMHDYNLSTSSNLPQALVQENYQLIYVPRWKHQFRLEGRFKSYRIQYVHQYASIRYTDTQNTSWLPSYQIGQVTVMKSLKFEHGSLDIVFNLMNCWNTNYQVVLNRPVPLRNYQLTLQIHI